LAGEESIASSGERTSDELLALDEEEEDAAICAVEFSRGSTAAGDLIPMGPSPK
jgi:hypothetical protein